MSQSTPMDHTLAKFAASFVIMLLVTMGLGFAIGRDDTVPAVTTTKTVTTPDLSFMQTADTLARELADYKMVMCGPNSIGYCAPSSPAVLTSLSNTTIRAVWAFSSTGCNYTSAILFRWDGTGFRIQQDLWNFTISPNCMGNPAGPGEP